MEAERSRVAAGVPVPPLRNTDMAENLVPDVKKTKKKILRQNLGNIGVQMFPEPGTIVCFI